MNSSIELNGNGQKVCLENRHHLWEPKSPIQPQEEPLWHLRVSVLKDQEGQGDCPGRYFVCSIYGTSLCCLLCANKRKQTFKSMHHLTHAANQLESAFREEFDIRKCGCDHPDAMGGRVNDGRSENITIEFETETAKEGWKQFLGRLKVLEDEWEHEESML